VIKQWTSRAAMLRLLQCLVLPAVQFGAFAQSTAQSAADSPVGLWQTIDDETKKPRSLVRIVESGGTLSGAIEKLIDPEKPNPVCEKCADERKDKPIIGMTIMTGLQKFEHEWGEGRILDPNNGKVYRCKAKLLDGGKKLEVRGFIGVSLIGRSQIWLRQQ
jgi:uncharacterized protein (DUF2147 family)